MLNIILLLLAWPIAVMCMIGLFALLRFLFLQDYSRFGIKETDKAKIFLVDAAIKTGFIVLGFLGYFN